MSWFPVSSHFYSLNYISGNYCTEWCSRIGAVPLKHRSAASWTESSGSGFFLTCWQQTLFAQQHLNNIKHWNIICLGFNVEAQLIQETFQSCIKSNARVTLHFNHKVPCIWEQSNKCKLSEFPPSQKCSILIKCYKSPFTWLWNLQFLDVSSSSVLTPHRFACQTPMIWSALTEWPRPPEPPSPENKCSE